MAEIVYGKIGAALPLHENVVEMGATGKNIAPKPPKSHEARHFLIFSVLRTMESMLENREEPQNFPHKKLTTILEYVCISILYWYKICRSPNFLPECILAYTAPFPSLLRSSSSLYAVLVSSRHFQCLDSLVVRLSVPVV